MPRLHQAFKIHKPLLNDNNIVVLEVGSILQKRDIEDRAFSRMDEFLKRELKNFSIQLQIKVSSVQVKHDMIYTATDKYKYLAEKNEDLNKLKLKFGLDLE